MENIKLAGKSFEFTAIGLNISFTNFENNLCVEILETVSDDDSSSVEEFIIFDVTSVSKKFKAEDPVEVNDESNDKLGYLIVGDSIIRGIANSPSLRSTSIIYFLLMDQLINGESVENSVIPFGFETSELMEERAVLFVYKHRAQDYINSYKSGSDLWGGFSHRKVQSVCSEDVSIISAIPNISYPTEEHKNKAYYATSSDNSFTRFLNKYQIIELLFDYLTVAKLRGARNNLAEFREIMNAYSSSEIALLKAILNEYVQDSNKLATLMYEFESYESTTLAIFQKHSKDSNPLKNESNWDKFWLALKGQKLTYTDISNDKTLKFSTIRSIDEFSSSITNIVSYWIYRVRCSIAHNKIGEYIFLDTEEVFIVNAMEPLLDEILSQILTNPELKKVLENSKIVGELIHE